MKIETIKVKYKNPVMVNGEEIDYVLINKADFNKDLHIKYGETPEEKPAAKKSKSAKAKD